MTRLITRLLLYESLPANRCIECRDSIVFCKFTRSAAFLSHIGSLPLTEDRTHKFYQSPRKCTTQLPAKPYFSYMVAIDSALKFIIHDRMPLSTTDTAACMRRQTPRLVGLATNIIFGHNSNSALVIPLRFNMHNWHALFENTKTRSSIITTNFGVFKPTLYRINIGLRIKTFLRPK